ncbi:hypothetical protein JVT61DRAFT_3476 [Boletus reticuloceps]|uniref:DUF6534 domain-containing protein n=1 Tax=Boletus reticuloceps TaxID=495285 RepID=A0A8I2YMF6_9AGAM|nr:hypothetical protein JVT61DRAFT_3476 [Boletus reticuloceps]
MGALDNTFGAFLIGVVVSATLYGVTIIQTWYYYNRYPSDPWYIKLLVAGVLVSDSCHQALITHTVYTYLVTDFETPAALANIVWSLVVEVFFNGFTALFVQSFLAMRVYRLSSKSRLATGSVMVLVIGEFILVTVYAIQALQFHTFIQLSSLKALSMSVNAVAAAGDVLIAIFLCTLLQKSRTGFRRSDNMINKLIVFSINTGLLTSICAVASLISITAWPNTFIYIAFYFCLGRLYCNSLLATLNARKGLRSESRSDEMSLSLQGVQQKTNQIGTTSKRTPNNISIKIDTTHEFVRDEYSASSGDMKSPEVV